VSDLVELISSLKKPFSKEAEAELPQEVWEEQKKSALKAGRGAILTFFNVCSKFNFEPETLERVWNVFIWPGLDEMMQLKSKLNTSSSPSWIMKLFQVWSLHERFHIFFAKCRTDLKDEDAMTPMKVLFEVLTGAGIHFEIQKYLIGILLNLTQSSSSVDESNENIDENPTFSLQNAEKFDGRPLNRDGIYEFERKGIKKTIHKLILNFIISCFSRSLYWVERRPLWKSNNSKSIQGFCII
jgi:hypothetical protein